MNVRSEYWYVEAKEHVGDEVSLLDGDIIWFAKCLKKLFLSNHLR